MTLAHELGHGVPQVLAAPNGALMAPSPYTLAETASVFGEMLTFKKLLVEHTLTTSCADLSHRRAHRLLCRYVVPPPIRATPPSVGRLSPALGCRGTVIWS
jgi:hypothetical protein